MRPCVLIGQCDVYAKFIQLKIIPIFSITSVGNALCENLGWFTSTENESFEKCCKVTIFISSPELKAEGELIVYQSICRLCVCKHFQP